MTTIQQRRGLANIGNTCYLNSALQALRYTKPLADYFQSNKWQRHAKPDRKGHALTNEFAKLITEFQTPSENPMIIPRHFIQEFIAHAQSVGSDEIRFGSQADASEAIHLLLDGIHTQLARPVRMDIVGESKTYEQRELSKSLENWSKFFQKEYSSIVDIFYGQTQTSMICSHCGATSNVYEPWSIMKVPIPGAEVAGAPAPNLQDCFRSMCEKELLEGYRCDGCKNTDTTYSVNKISRFPSHMIVSMKRFTNRGAKVRARIPYNDAFLDLSEFSAWKTMYPASHMQYRVYATIEHLGSSVGGHYLMRARDGGSWLMYDDASCSMAADGGKATADTYILFLERITESG